MSLRKRARLYPALAPTAHVGQSVFWERISALTFGLDWRNGFEAHASRDHTLVGPLWEGYHESKTCSRDTYPESYVTKYTSIRRQIRACELPWPYHASIVSESFKHKVLLRGFRVSETYVALNKSSNSQHVPHGGLRVIRSQFASTSSTAGPYVVCIWSRNTLESGPNETLVVHRVVACFPGENQRYSKMV